LEFAIKLNALSEEYESDAQRPEAKDRILWRKAYSFKKATTRRIVTASVGGIIVRKRLAPATRCLR
jgi:hypothetical protein